MIHPHVTPESGNGPVSDAPAEGVEPGSAVESSLPPALTPPVPPPSPGHAASADESGRPSERPAAAFPPTAEPAETAGDQAPTTTPPQAAPPRPLVGANPSTTALRRIDARIRRLEKVVMALVKRERRSLKSKPIPVAQAAVVPWQPPAVSAPPNSPDVEPVPVPPSMATALPASVAESAPRSPILPPAAPAPTAPPESLLPLISPPPPPLELSAPPVAAIAAEIPVANLAVAPPVAALAPSEPVPPEAITPPAPGLRERIVARVLSSPAAGQAMAAAAVPLARAAVALTAAPTGTPTHPFRHPWVAMEAYHELRGVIRMYRDRSYRPGLYAWLIPVIALSFMICSYFFVALTIPWVGPWIDKLVDFVLAYVAYKAMVREAERYELERRSRQQPV